jgi:diguanylate cyclase (GGDEF)-like protein
MYPGDFSVLLVDDDPAMLRILATWLKKAGYHVRQAEDGREALAAIEAECPDFLITDWEMPFLNGVELCGKVRTMDLPHYIFVMFLTVRSAPEELVLGMDMGADDFLIKPVNKNELLSRVQAGCRVLKLERRLSVAIGTDPLTGLTTRRTFQDMVRQGWQRTRQRHSPLSCVMIDVDFFKRVNDTRGHSVGDLMLKAVADLLTDTGRANDLICRYGGDEFCVLLPETDEKEAAAWAERALQKLSTTVITVDGEDIRVTASFGVSQEDDDIQTPEMLLDRADQALLCAKHSGRDRVVRFGSMISRGGQHPQVCAELSDIFESAAARHVMSPLVACIREDELVGQAAEFFLRSRISSSPIVNADGKLVGVLSEKDLMAAMVSLDCWQIPVRDVMHSNVITYNESAPVRKIFEFLCRVSIRRVVIVKGGCPTGTISRGTLLRWFRNLVITKGLAERSELPAVQPELDVYRSKRQLAETSRELAFQASKLEQRFREETDDLVPYVVGSATRMQELVNDLLAHSRFANEGKNQADPHKLPLVGDGVFD